jgi:hypothetical protein
MNLSAQQFFRDPIASAQVEEVISVLEELSETRKARYIEGRAPTVDELLDAHEDLRAARSILCSRRKRQTY